MLRGFGEKKFCGIPENPYLYKAICEGCDIRRKKRIGFTFLLMKLGGFIDMKVARLMLTLFYTAWASLHDLHIGYAKTSSVDM